MHEFRAKKSNQEYPHFSDVMLAYLCCHAYLFQCMMCDHETDLTRKVTD